MSRVAEPEVRASALRHVRDGRTWFYLPVWVLGGRRGGVLIQLVPGTSGCAAYRADGTRAHLADRTWHLAPYMWSENALTYYVPRRSPIAVGLLSCDHVPVRWYANVQRTTGTTGFGMETLDYELDWQSPWREGSIPMPWDWRVKDLRDWFAAVGSSGIGVPVAAAGVSSICCAAAALREGVGQDLERWARTPLPPPTQDWAVVRPDDVEACLGT